MTFPPGNIHDVIVRPLKRHEDPRGWLIELFRADEMSAELAPVMSYLSVTHPGVARGPHEHTAQTDIFCFLGPSDFRLLLWDNRRSSPTHGCSMDLVVGTSRPTIVIVPPGVVHGYKNVGAIDGLVVNCPNRLYAGAGRKEPVDEIRHEEIDSIFRFPE